MRLASSKKGCNASIVPITLNFKSPSCFSERANPPLLLLDELVLLSRIGDTIHAASMMSMMPNTRCRPIIHLPVVGISMRASTAMKKSGSPMPSAITNSNPPPKLMDPVCAIKPSTPASGAVIHGLATKVDIPPKIKAPVILPPF